MAVDPPRLYGLDGGYLAVLDKATEIVHEEVLGSSDTLKFHLPGDDPKEVLVLEDESLTYDDDVYRITKVDRDRHDNGVRHTAVEAEGLYVELLDAVKTGTFEVIAKSAAAGLTTILDGTAWTVGTVEDFSDDAYSLSEQNKTVLYLVRTWAKIVGLEVLFDTSARTVSLVASIGEDLGVGFRYAKNLKSVLRSARAPLATRLYPYGRNGLSIQDVNLGVAYVEDFSWYVAHGLTEEQARAAFLKETILTDDRFLSGDSLLAYATRKLAQLAQPLVSYSCSVLDLADLTGVDQSFAIGDTIHVYDSELEVDVQARIVRYQKSHSEPWKNAVELAYLIPGLETLQEDVSLSGEAGLVGEQLIAVQNEGAITFTTSTVLAAEIALTSFSFTNATGGFKLHGSASEPMKLTAELLFDGAVIQTWEMDVGTGAHAIAFPFLLLSIPSGTRYLQMRVKTSTGTFTASEVGDIHFWVQAKNLAGGAGGTGTPRVTVFDTVVVTLPTVTDDPDAEVQTPVPATATDTADDEPVTVTEEVEAAAIYAIVVAASGDDGYITSAPLFNNAGSDTEVGDNGGISEDAWYRFELPEDISDKIILRAYLKGTGDSTTSGALTTVYAELASSATAPSARDDYIARPTTSASPTWDSAVTTGVEAKSPDIGSVIEELQAAYGASLDVIQILHKNRGSPSNGRMVFRSKDHGTGPPMTLELWVTDA